MYGNAYPHEDLHVLNVDWLIKQYKELTAKYTELLDSFASLKTDFNSLKSDFDDIRTEFDALLQTIEKEIEEITSQKIDEALAVYRTELEALRESVSKTNVRLNEIEVLLNDYITGARQYTDDSIESLRVKLEAQITLIQKDINDLQWTLPKVYNLTKGIWTDLVTLVYDVYDATRDNAYTALEFDSASWTCEKFDSADHTAYQWDTNGREYLYPRGYCINPITGERENICSILEQMQMEITKNNSLTAQQYDSMMLTADAYDSLELTAYTYDYFGSLFIRG